MDTHDDARVIDYWKKIASSWAITIRSGGIPSRKEVTNKAIVQTILDRSPESVLDIGCGEGWLCRTLAQSGASVTGIDVVPELIAQARAAGPGEYMVLSYDDVAAGKLSARFDVVVCNFSLLGKESVDRLVGTVHSLLNLGGSFIVQTVHPLMAEGDDAYKDGWRVSPWTGITTEISDPSPWYFRTLGTWIRLFTTANLRLVDIHEPLHSETARPASIILVAEV